jgi:hypothetical protein
MPLKDGIDVHFMLPDAVNIQMSPALLLPTPTTPG